MHSYILRNLFVVYYSLQGPGMLLLTLPHALASGAHAYSVPWADFVAVGRDTALALHAYQTPEARPQPAQPICSWQFGMLTDGSTPPDSSWSRHQGRHTA